MNVANSYFGKVAGLHCLEFHRVHTISKANG